MSYRKRSHPARTDPGLIVRRLTHSHTWLVRTVRPDGSGEKWEYAGYQIAECEDVLSEEQAERIRRDFGSQGEAFLRAFYERGAGQPVPVADQANAELERAKSEDLQRRLAAYPDNPFAGRGCASSRLVEREWKREVLGMPVPPPEPCPHCGAALLTATATGAQACSDRDCLLAHGWSDCELVHPHPGQQCWKPAPAIGADASPPLHLVVRGTGRAACGYQPAHNELGVVRPDALVSFPGARCEYCVVIANQELAPSAVAAAPAARPRLTVACQSQFDPDD